MRKAVRGQFGSATVKEESRRYEEPQLRSIEQMHTRSKWGRCQSKYRWPTLVNAREGGRASEVLLVACCCRIEVDGRKRVMSGWMGLGLDLGSAEMEASTANHESQCDGIWFTGDEIRLDVDTSLPSGIYWPMMSRAFSLVRAGSSTQSRPLIGGSWSTLHTSGLMHNSQKKAFDPLNPSTTATYTTRAHKARFRQ